MPVAKFYSTTEDGFGTTNSMNTVYPYMSVGADSSEGMDSDSQEFHTFLFFKTFELPLNAIIKEVKLYYYVGATQGEFLSIKLRTYIGNNTSGSTLTTADYNATVVNGELLGDATSGTGQKTLTSTHEDIIAEISRDQYTNVEIDAYWVGQIGSSGSLSKIMDTNNATDSRRPRLDIHYSLPTITII